MTPSVAIVQDHIVQQGGGERVLLAMARALPDAPIYTTFFVPEVTFDEFRTLDIRTVGANRIRLLREHHRSLLPAFPALLASRRIEADVVVCGNAGWAQGARVRGRKVVYFHAMASWLYRDEHYLRDKGAVARTGLAVVRPWLRRWDQRTGRSADRYFVYGPSMQRRVAEAYGVDADILRPPVVIDAGGPQRRSDGIEPGFFLCATRLVSYKNPDKVVEAFNAMRDERVVIAGGGPEYERLKAMAGPNVTVFGNADNEQLRWLYANCRALIAAGYEPYGLTPVEAAAFGKGSIALASDGLLDTMVDGRTGVLFEAPEADAIRAAVTSFSDGSVDPESLRQMVADHAESRFAEQLRNIVAEEARVNVRP